MLRNILTPAGGTVIQTPFPAWAARGETRGAEPQRSRPGTTRGGVATPGGGRACHPSPALPLGSRLWVGVSRILSGRDTRGPLPSGRRAAEKGEGVAGGPSPCGPRGGRGPSPGERTWPVGRWGDRGGAKLSRELRGSEQRGSGGGGAERRGGGRRAHGAPRPRRQRAPSRPAALNAPQRRASNPSPEAMPVMKGLLAPQNTFLDTIATRFDGTREWGEAGAGCSSWGQVSFGTGAGLLDVLRPEAARVELAV